MLDIGHKLLSPQTYSCNLCRMTHGLLKEKEGWKKFREASGHELEFLHKDEFEQKYQMQTGYPVILQEQDNGTLQAVVGQAERKTTTPFFPSRPQIMRPGARMIRRKTAQITTPVYQQTNPSTAD